MKKTMMKRFALTEKGAADMLKAILAVTLSNIALMLPVCLLFAFTGDYLAGKAAGRWAYYMAFAAVCLVLIFLPNFWQYNATFYATYTESGKRRISLHHVSDLFVSKTGRLLIREPRNCFCIPQNIPLRRR